VRVGLIHLNEKYLQLFIPREKTVYRFPSSELYKNNTRRDKFLTLLPIPIYPEIFLEAVLSLSQLNGAKSTPCRYLEKENVYSFFLKDKVSSKWIDIDPTRFLPTRVFYFDTSTPGARETDSWRPTHEIHFEEWNGDGLATIPTEISMWNGKEQKFRFHWKDAESWKNYDEKSFEWQPSASIAIKDY
jgi:hypothetical protein